MATHTGMTTAEFEQIVTDWIATARHPNTGRHFREMVYQPIGINFHIGRRPIAAFGNSDGDMQMLQWTTAGKGARLGVLIHHTDAERE